MALTFVHPPLYHESEADEEDRAGSACWLGFVLNATAGTWLCWH